METLKLTIESALTQAAEDYEMDVTRSDEELRHLARQLSWLPGDELQSVYVASYQVELEHLIEAYS